MSEKKSLSYEKNFTILETITESLNKDEIAIDDLVDKTREALVAARNCMKILQQQHGEFEKLEREFSDLLKENGGADETQDNGKNASVDTEGTKG